MVQTLYYHLCTTKKNLKQGDDNKSPKLFPGHAHVISLITPGVCTEQTMGD